MVEKAEQLNNLSIEYYINHALGGPDCKSGTILTWAGIRELSPENRKALTPQMPSILRKAGAIIEETRNITPRDLNEILDFMRSLPETSVLKKMADSIEGLSQPTKDQFLELVKEVTNNSKSLTKNSSFPEPMPFVFKNSLSIFSNLLGRNIFQPRLATDNGIVLPLNQPESKGENIQFIKALDELPAGRRLFFTGGIIAISSVYSLLSSAAGASGTFSLLSETGKSIIEQPPTTGSFGIAIFVNLMEYYLTRKIAQMVKDKKGKETPADAIKFGGAVTICALVYIYDIVSNYIGMPFMGITSQSFWIKGPLSLIFATIQEYVSDDFFDSWQDWRAGKTVGGRSGRRLESN